MHKKHNKHNQHYLICKLIVFSCNPSCRLCLNHSITFPTPRFTRVVYIHQVRGPSGPPHSVILNLNDPMPLGLSKCLIHCRIEALVYLCCWSEGHNTTPAPPQIISRRSQECVRKVDFVDLTKDREFLSKGFARNQCFYILSMINAGFGMFGQYHQS